MKTALIAGATGLVGGHLLRFLLQNDEFTKVVSIGRREVDIKHPKLEQLVIDFNNLNDITIPVDAVFCCLGTTIKKAGSQEKFRMIDFSYPLKLAEFGLNNGADSFHLVSAMGANSRASVFYNQTKGQVEEVITKLKYSQLHLYRPSLLLGERTEKRFLEELSGVVMIFFSFMFIGPLKNYKAIEASKVAKAMYNRSLTNVKGVFIHLSGEMQ